MNFVAICNLWKLHVRVNASVCRSFSFEKPLWKTLHFLHISTSPYLENSNKAIALQGIKVSWYFYREAYTRLLLQSQTVLGHFSEGHFAVTSQTIPSFGEKKTVCVFVKRKCGLNEDLYDSEQFTYNVLCQLLPYNDITALLVAHELLAALSNQTVFQLQTRTKYFHTWLASLRCFYYIVFSTVEHKKRKIIFF